MKEIEKNNMIETLDLAANSIFTSKSDHSISRDLIDILKYTTCLVDLDVSSNLCSDLEPLEIFFEGLSLNSSIKVIDIYDTNFHSTMDNFKKCMKKNKSIKYLKLDVICKINSKLKLKSYF